MTIVLPIPAPILSPNGRGHWTRKHKATKAARQLARLTTQSALQGDTPPRVSRYRLRYCHGVRRLRDDDNAIAMTKAYRDGIADALGIDDNALRIDGPPELHIDPANPRLEIQLLP